MPVNESGSIREGSTRLNLITHFALARRDTREDPRCPTQIIWLPLRGKSSPSSPVRSAPLSRPPVRIGATRCTVISTWGILIEAQGRVSSGWKWWLRENCFLSVRTAMLYMQLARHRAEIEAEIERMGELSLRAAIRLIAEPVEKESKPKPDLMVAWNRATPEELTRHLDAVTVMGLLRIISLAFRRELEGRLRKEKTEDASEPHYKLTMALRTALGCVKIADDPQTSPAVALSQEKAALNALRGLTRMHADLNGLSVGFREAKDPKRDSKGDQRRRRAA